VTPSSLEETVKRLYPALLGDEASFSRADAELMRIDAENAQDAFAQYLIGSAYDSCGRGHRAIVHYERVFALGAGQLPEHRRPEIYVQAGSTFRNLGRFDAARRLFAEGIAQYPEYRALRVFAAMNETSAGDTAAASAHLYAYVLVAEDGSFARFQRSLTWYIGELVRQGRTADA
jgi:tetratricopeptide (TPR) repeat protein